jgi:hypothetical protein
MGKVLGPFSLERLQNQLALLEGSSRNNFLQLNQVFFSCRFHWIVSSDY